MNNKQNKTGSRSRVKERVSVCGSELWDGNVWERQREGRWYHSMVLGLREREQQAWRRLCVRFGVNVPVSNTRMRNRGRDVDEKRRRVDGWERKEGLRLSRPLESYESELHIFSSPW